MRSWNINKQNTQEAKNTAICYVLKICVWLFFAVDHWFDPLILGRWSVLPMCLCAFSVEKQCLTVVKNYTLLYNVVTHETSTLINQIWRSCHIRNSCWHQRFNHLLRAPADQVSAQWVCTVWSTQVHQRLESWLWESGDNLWVAITLRRLLKNRSITITGLPYSFSFSYFPSKPLKVRMLCFRRKCF